MNIQELIERYLKNECTPDETAYLARYFKKTPGALEDFLKEADWENFEYDQKLHPAVSERLFETISRKKARSITIYKTIKRTMAAAAMIITIVATVLLFKNNQAEEEKRIGEIETATPASRLITEVNNSTVKKIIRMKDSSVIELFPGSEIKFYEPFVMNGKRRIYLKGEAFFRVAKDKANPFIVYSDEISTTAVGTSFTIKNIEKEQFIKVHLHTGKVAVKAADALKDSTAEEMYLAPGDLFSYDKQKRTASISRPEKVNSNDMPVNNNNPVNFATVDWYMINNQPLDQVFEQLEQLYGISIIYSKQDIKSMYFIGKFEKTDSLEGVLRDITFLNNLKYKKVADNKYIISKIQ